MTSDNSANQMQLEMLAQHTGEPLSAVLDIYEREYAALAQQARIPNFISLLALRRARNCLLPLKVSEVH
jgi:hypothetical protein